MDTCEYAPYAAQYGACRGPVAPRDAIHVPDKPPRPLRAFVRQARGEPAHGTDRDLRRWRRTLVKIDRIGEQLSSSGPDRVD